jgi:S1-C subfamily serine protease
VPRFTQRSPDSTSRRLFSVTPHEAGIEGYRILTAVSAAIPDPPSDRATSDGDSRATDSSVASTEHRPKPLKVSKSDGSAIRNMSAESELSDALGLVVCGVNVVEADGEEVDRPLSTGSCFAISPDGFLLTNKHVVEDTKKLLNARLLLQRLRDKDLLDVRPKVWLFFGKEKFNADIVYVSDDFDFSILKVSRICRHYFRLSAASQKLPRGKKVVA